MVTKSIRWVFRCGDWRPNHAQWLQTNSCVQPEEIERISKFVYKKDAKAAMAGRLLMRKAIAYSLNTPYNTIQLIRTDKGKPILKNNPAAFPNFNFNVSHQGAVAVLAVEPCHQVGIDVMKIEYPRGRETTEEFFDLMLRQFTPHEWGTIKAPLDEWDQLANFYRHWCLKESYVKAVGVGIGYSLQRLDFHLNSDLESDNYVSDTKVYVDGVVDDSWRFEECMLDSTHCVAVALHKVSSEPFPEKSSVFTTLDFSQLVEGSEALTQPDEQIWRDFNIKEDTPWTRKS